MRVHELAKELGIPSKELVVQLKELGAAVKNHMSSVDDDAANLVRPADGKKSPSEETPVAADAPAPEKKPVAKKPAKETPPQPDGQATDSKSAFSTQDGGKTITVRGSVIVKDLAEALALRPNQVVAELMSMNVFASINQRLELKDAQKLAAKHGVSLEHEKKTLDHKPLPRAREEEEEADKPEDLQHRPPVVTLLGHVDHGKTSLLDRIRSTAVAKKEAGGITQHIGAYTVEAADHKITFIDTPGHAAFTAMRARGANLTDIAILVVAADDGIMPQTKEAIQHALAADASIIVAINKMDLPAANAQNVKQQLQTEGLSPEDWGGETICCEVSAETGAGVDHLLEMILLQAEVLELSANPNRKASGYVIEAQLESGMGPTASVLVKRGTLKAGDTVLCGSHWGRIKALINDRGEKVESAGPSMAAKCLGLSGVPEAGAEFIAYANEKLARSLANEAESAEQTDRISVPTKVSLDNFYEQLESAELLELKLVLKADTQGSLEAIMHTLDGIKSDKISLKLILTGIGNITTNDVLLASASNAVVIGFNVAKESGSSRAAKDEKVEINLHSIIYELSDEIREAMTGLLAPKVVETIIGHARVKEVFSISKIGKIAGCETTDGKITAKARARVTRGDDMIYEGGIGTLRRFQNEASEVREGQECGIRLANYENFEADDTIEFFETTRVAQTL